MGNNPISVEGVMKVFSFSLVLLAWSSCGSAEVGGRKYYKNFLGHVHKNASKDSSSLTIVQCSHSVKILKQKNPKKGWSFVQVGDDQGYIQNKDLLNKRPECFQGKYPHFYRSYNLDISEMYFWGRLYDHYVQGVSKIK
jgi:hypothetical protein